MRGVRDASRVFDGIEGAPMLTLIAQYYVPANKSRRLEIDTCFQKNIENPVITKFIIFFEREADMALLPSHKKIVKKFYPDRLTYGFWLKETNQLPTGSLSVLINSDIYLTESANHLVIHRDLLLEQKKFVALSRYNPDGDGFKLNSNPHWTQDTWAVVKPKEGFPSALIQETSFELGQPGCDNKIVAVMHSYGFNVTNPCETVQTIHLQADEKRSYDARANKLLGLHAFSYATRTVRQDSKLEFDLLSRNLEPYEEIRANNWINDSKSYALKANPAEIADLQAKFKKSIELFEPSFESKNAASSHGFVAADGYDYIRREGFVADQYKLTHAFDKQFKVYEDQTHWYFYDLYWPHVRRIKRDPSKVGAGAGADLIRLFALGYLPCVLELDGLSIGVTKRFDSDSLFWQMPAKTEADAYERHKKLPTPQIDKAAVHVYVGLPWASIIDQYKFNPVMKDAAIPVALIGMLSARLRAARRVLLQHGKQLRVHTVCQQIYWRDIADQFRKLGVTDLWLAHKTTKADELAGTALHAWPLVAVNIETPMRRVGLKQIPINERKWLASFIGAYMAHYGNDARLKMVEALKDKTGYCLKLNDMWHFNEEVYNQQLGLQVKAITAAAQFKVSDYNEALSDSKFSLCPVGAGPNTLRLWESLAMGSVPVVISDVYEFPALCKDDGSSFDWLEAVVVHPESDMAALDQRLRAYTPEQLQRMHDGCLEAYRLILAMTCFGALPRPQPAKPIKVYVPYYGPDDKYFWRSVHHGLYDLVMAWQEKGWCDVEHHAGPYYWINGLDSILLFDRDQVADLIDKKKAPPRWQGEVPYKYAFFTNEYGLENDRNLKFNYWSYKPVELEKLVRGTPALSYKDRNIDSVFLGSMENETQEYFRNKFKDWGQHIQEFYVADKLNNKEKAKYSFEQYLDKVAHARFGVCFRGNGPKCYREIEYAALGTPLIVTEGVDVDYPEPLLEGVHFFHARQATDIAKIVAETDAKTWATMSSNCREWYLRNCTVEAQYQGLLKAVKALDLTRAKPTTVYIHTPGHEGYQLTEASCKIFNPDVQIVTDPALNVSGVVLQAGDVVINELPYLGGKANYAYAIKREQVKTIREKTLASNLMKNKQLATLLKWRLANFKVWLSRSGKALPTENYINDVGQLVIEDPEVEYRIEIDYDYRRGVSGKYVGRTVQGKGKLVFPELLVLKAELQCEQQERSFVVDLTERYAEYVAMTDAFVPDEQVWRKFKLWEYEECTFSKLPVQYVSGEKHAAHIHQHVKFHKGV